jgi:hypothetical protein
LQQHTFCWPTGPAPSVNDAIRLGWLAYPSCFQQSVERRAPYHNLLLSLQEILQVTDVHVLILPPSASQGHDLLYYGGIRAIGRLSASVAMNYGAHAFLAIPGTQPADLSGSHSEYLRCRAYIECSYFQSIQNLYSPLLSVVQGYCPHFSSIGHFP